MRVRSIAVAGAAGGVLLLASIGAWLHGVSRSSAPSRSDAASGALSSLVADPLAARARPEARLLLAEDRRHEDSDAVTGKPTTTQVLRAFAPTSGTPTRLLEDLRAEALRNGWSPEEGAVPTEVRATKAFSFGQGHLVVTVNTATAPATVVVSLAPANPNL
jgi:hypothetical protein